jgi:LPS O-antigen subunit length determinant protein (WzzB/FepE family)
MIYQEILVIYLLQQNFNELIDPVKNMYAHPYKKIAEIKGINEPELKNHIFNNISDDTCKMLGLNPDRSRPEYMIYDIFLVPPIHVRPPVKGDIGGGQSEDDLTRKIGDIIKANERMKKEKDREFLKKQIDVNLLYGARFDGLEQMRDEKIVKLEKFLDSYEQAESDAYANFTHKFIVERAVVADKKDKPKRLIIVLLAAMGTFVFMVFLLLINEKFKELKKQA